jgi:hypothetical protein
MLGEERLHVDADTRPVTYTAKRTGTVREVWILEGVEAFKYHVIERSDPEDPPLVELGRFLVRVSGVDRCLRPTAFKQEAAGRAKAERLSKQRIVLSHKAARVLLARLEAEGLTCPHCLAHTRDMRYIDRSPRRDVMSHFICRSCGRSFAPEDLE